MLALCSKHKFSAKNITRCQVLFSLLSEAGGAFFVVLCKDGGKVALVILSIFGGHIGNGGTMGLVDPFGIGIQNVLARFRGGSGFGKRRVARGVVDINARLGVVGIDAEADPFALVLHAVAFH